MRRESIEAFGKGGRPELVAKEEAELALLVAYLPAQLDRDAVRERARAVIAEIGASGPHDQGKVMQKLMAALRGQAEGKLVAEVVGELLRQV